MPKLKKCPECGGKMEQSKNIDADICSICGAQYLTAEADEHIEKIIDKILAKKILAYQENVFRIAAEA